MLKCFFVSNKLLLLCWFKFLLLLTNSLQNRITLLLVLKLLQSTKLTSRIHFFLLHHDVFVSSVSFFNFFFFLNFITLISHFYFPKSLHFYLKKKKKKTPTIKPVLLLLSTLIIPTSLKNSYYYVISHVYIFVFHFLTHDLLIITNLHVC